MASTKKNGEFAEVFDLSTSVQDGGADFDGSTTRREPFREFQPVQRIAPSSACRDSAVAF
jgi:hypothetical protein